MKVLWPSRSLGQIKDSRIAYHITPLKGKDTTVAKKSQISPAANSLILLRLALEQICVGAEPNPKTAECCISRYAECVVHQ